MTGPDTVTGKSMWGRSSNQSALCKPERTPHHFPKSAEIPLPFGQWVIPEKTMALKKPLQQVNVNNVDEKKWRNWPDICQRVFNETFFQAKENQQLYMHPKAKAMKAEHWDTTAWNSAWMAADSCQRALKDIIKGKGYAKND